ncbi:hypothetical protein V8C37DRAFT_381385 [Trichoderma ceciliae]
MSGKSRLDRVYAQLLSDHPYGWALYKKVTTREIHPGCCGYFDPDGDWHTIADLSDPDDVAGKGWSLPYDSISDSKAPASTIWGPKSSSSVQTRHIGGTAKTATAAPIKTSMTVSFKSSSQQGAVLTTANPVLKHQISDELIALEWMADNTPEMMRRHSDIVKRHGVWIVTKTYSTRRSANAILTSESSSIEINLDSVQGLLTLTPMSTWLSSSGNSCTELHEDEDGVVVFISGMYFTQKLFRSKLVHSTDQRKQRDNIFRGDHIGWDDEDDEIQILDVEYYPRREEDGIEDETEEEFI